MECYSLGHSSDPVCPFLGSPLLQCQTVLDVCVTVCEVAVGTPPYPLPGKLPQCPSMDS